MADFRKLIYAFALVALFASLTVSVNAQGLYCSTLTATPQILRAEGYTEYVGDIVLRCAATTTGVRTPVGQIVPYANVHVTIPGTTITSRHIGTSSKKFVEPLLLIDEPGKPGSIITSQTYCGQTGNDSGPSAAGVCEIIAPSQGDYTYDGTTYAQYAGGNDFSECSGSTYGCGRPNIYQGVLDGPNTVTFPGIPMDPPGTQGYRTIRITNIRIDATKFDPASLPSINAIVTLEGTASVALQFNTTQVGTVLSGISSKVTGDTNFLQCLAEPNRQHSQQESIIISEGFRSAWKPRNVQLYVDNYVNYSGATVPTWLVDPYQFSYDTGRTVNGLVDASQNIPDVHYFSESDFENTAWTGDSFHGIGKAGSADYGTRLAFTLSAPPANTKLTIPTVVYLSNGTNTTGVMVMTSYGTGPTGFVGNGPYAPVSGGTFTVPSGGATVVYEVLFSDPASTESAEIDGLLSYCITASSSCTPITDAAINVPTTITAATFAPFYTAVGVDADGIPRFKDTRGTPGTWVEIGKCACNLLFPWVVSDSNYITGIAVANTSKDPTNDATIGVAGYTASQQAGKVTLYLFGTVAGTPASSTTLPSSAVVPAGSYATFVVNSGFTGYAIANAQFQYCHGLAFLFNAGGSVPPVSYLGLVMDHGRSFGGRLSRTTQLFYDSQDN